MRKALLFSGTSDGSRLALCLAGRGWLVTERLPLMTHILS